MTFTCISQIICKSVLSSAVLNSAVTSNIVTESTKIKMLSNSNIPNKRMFLKGDADDIFYGQFKW